MIEIFGRRTFLAGAITATAVMVAGCQTTTMQPVTADRAPSLYTATWAGHFINRQGTKYPVTFFLTGRNGQINGKADIPDSSYDSAPTITGTYNGASSKMESSSGFKYDLTMTESEDGSYWIKGSVTGPNVGQLELRRQ